MYQGGLCDNYGCIKEDYVLILGVSRRLCANAGCIMEDYVSILGVSWEDYMMILDI